MPSGKYKDLVKFLGFQSFLWTQFLGAFNDNVYKIVISMFAVDLSSIPDGGSRFVPLVGAVFILPFLAFSGYAGYLADTFNKRMVLILTKSTEIIAATIGLAVILSQNIGWMLAGLFLMALHSTFFSPAKYGILPEMLSSKDLSRGNGLVEMTTFLAIILGTSFGSILFAVWKGHQERIGLVLILVALAGTLVSLGIARVPSPSSRPAFRFFPWSEILWGLTRLYHEKLLWVTVWSISFFWFFGALLQMDILLVGKEIMHLDDLKIGLLGTYLAVGIGTGSLAAGRLSGDRVEPGIVPLGLVGMGVFSLWLSVSGSSYTEFSVVLALLGFSGGLFIVPLNTLLQYKSGAEERGRVIAANNFLNMAGVLLASGVLWVLRNVLEVPAHQIILIFGIFLISGAYFLMTVLPVFKIRLILWLFSQVLYKTTVSGEDKIPHEGPALLVCSPLSPQEYLWISASLQRTLSTKIPGTVVEKSRYGGLFHLISRLSGVSSSREDARQTLRRILRAYENGQLICLDPQEHELFKTVRKKLSCSVIPVLIILPEKKSGILTPVTVLFGDPISAAASSVQITEDLRNLEKQWLDRTASIA